MTWPFPRVQHFCNWQHLCIFSECAKQNKTKNNWVTLGTVCLRTLCLLLKQGTQLCPTLCNLMDCSPPGSSVHEIFQARILEWVAIPFSRGSSWPRDWTHVSWVGRWILYPWATQEAPATLFLNFQSSFSPSISGHHLHCCQFIFLLTNMILCLKTFQWLHISQSPNSRE